MKNLNKNLIKSKLASYSAVAACLLASGFEASAQCGTAAPGAPLPVDIDGDGTPDVTIVANNFPGPYVLNTGMASTAIPTFTTMVNFSQTATITQPGPGTSFNGCITTFYNGTNFTGIVPSATAMGTLMWSTTLQFSNVNIISNYATFYSVNQAYIVPSTGNALIGQTVAGASVCTLVAGGGNPYEILGTCFNISTSYLTYGVGDISSMYFPNPAGGGTFTYDAPPCTTTGGAIYYAGFMQTLGPATGTVVTTGVLVTGPNYFGPNLVSTQCTPGSTFVGVEFAGGDGTQYGWVEVTYNPDGTVTCVNTGYNGCSVEEVTAAGGTLGTDECIAVGAATVNTADEACMLPDALAITDPCNCAAGLDLDGDPDGINEFALETITVSGGTAPYIINSATDLYDSNGTLLTVADLSVDANGNVITSTTGDGNVYVMAGGTPYTIDVSDSSSPAQNITQTNTPCDPCPAPPPTTDIPTLSQWGLITLMLALMSYGAIAMSGFGELAATLRRKEE